MKEQLFKELCVDNNDNMIMITMILFSKISKLFTKTRRKNVLVNISSSVTSLKIKINNILS